MPDAKHYSTGKQSRLRPDSPLDVLVTLRHDDIAYHARQDDVEWPMTADEVYEQIALRSGPAPHQALISVAIIGLAGALAIVLTASDPSRRAGLLFVALLASMVVAALVNRYRRWRRRFRYEYSDDLLEWDLTQKRLESIARLSVARQLTALAADGVSLTPHIVTVRSATPHFVDRNTKALCMSSVDRAIYFLPDGAYEKRNKRWTFAPYHDTQVVVDSIQVEEHNAFPEDTTIVRHTWLHARKDGMRDMRYAVNHPVVITRRGRVTFNLGDWSQFVMSVSNQQVAKGLETDWQWFKQRKAELAVTSAPLTNKVHSQTAAAITPQASTAGTASQEIAIEARNQKLAETAPTQAAKHEPQETVPLPATAMIERTVALPRTEVAVSARAGYVPVPVATRGDRFVISARANHSRRADPADFVPFKSYWPSIAELGKRELMWYLWWRSEWRAGRRLSTDTSYLFIYVYELINLVETDKPEAAAEGLLRLWHAYRAEHPELDKYLPEWAGDILVAAGRVQAAIATWLNTDVIHKLAPDIVNVLVDRHVHANTCDQIPVSIWLKLARYKPRPTFYSTSNADGFVENIYLQALQVADRHQRQTTGASLTANANTRVAPAKKVLFRSAVLGSSRATEYAFGDVPDYLSNAELSQFLSAVIQHAENVARERVHYATRLVMAAPPVDLANAIDRALGVTRSTTNPSARSSLPGSTIRPLAPASTPTPTLPVRSNAHQTSGDMPTTAPASRTTSKAPFVLKLDQKRLAAIQQDGLSQVLATQTQTNEKVSAKALYTELKEVRQIWRALPSNLRELIQAAFRAMDLGSYAEQSKVTEASVVDLVASVNQRAREVLGDNIIYVADSTLRVVDDFQDELSLVLREDIAPLVPSAPEQPPAPEPQVTADAPEDVNWRDLLDRLTPLEGEFLRFSLQLGTVPTKVIDTYARQVHVMPGVLIDGLNEHAIDSRQQPLLFQDGDNWIFDGSELAELRLLLRVSQAQPDIANMDVGNPEPIEAH